MTNILYFLLWHLCSTYLLSFLNILFKGNHLFWWSDCILCSIQILEFRISSIYIWNMLCPRWDKCYLRKSYFLLNYLLPIFVWDFSPQLNLFKFLWYWVAQLYVPSKWKLYFQVNYVVSVLAMGLWSILEKKNKKEHLTLQF